MVDKEKTIYNGNGEDEPKDSPDNPPPAIMIASKDDAQKLVQKLREETKLNQNAISLDKYHVMSGMQDEEKIPFFTELINDDDVARMNTIEAYNEVSLLCIRKTSPKNMERIKQLNKDIYIGHVKTHKRNMVSKGRQRENSYTKILSADSSDSGVVPTGIRKFFGIGGAKK